MTEPEYRPGDEVVCLDASDGAHFLHAGWNYTVESVQRDPAGLLRLVLAGMARAWEHTRFRRLAAE